MPVSNAESLFLLTDLYQLTMAQGYWKSGLAERQAAFNLSFRKAPFGGGFAVACGLEPALRFLGALSFTEGDRSYLQSVKGTDGQPLFHPEFLDFLRRQHLGCDVDAAPEGTLVFPNEPILRVQGPLWQAQMLETALLNTINFQSLIATKAARIRITAGDKQVLEFGLRRAQGMDGGLAASRAAYIGGCDATSNALAGKLYGTPVAGTHAHSWVMAFDTELDSFRAYADAVPNNSVFLVDTYDTISGVQHAIEAGRLLQEQGRQMSGIRLDSGDLGTLSKAARKLLDEAGFIDTKIVASSDLDEYAVTELNERGAPIAVLGIGTKLVTAHDDPALGGVYKLGAIRDETGRWQPKLKTSDDAAKASCPGVLQVRRFVNASGFVCDAVYNELDPPSQGWEIVYPDRPGSPQPVELETGWEDVLIPVLRDGQSVYEPPSIQDARRRTLDQLARCPERVKRLASPSAYPVGLEKKLAELRRELIERIQQTITRGS